MTMPLSKNPLVNKISIRGGGPGHLALALEGGAIRAGHLNGALGAMREGMALDLATAFAKTADERDGLRAAVMDSFGGVVAGLGDQAVFLTGAEEASLRLVHSVQKRTALLWRGDPTGHTLSNNWKRAFLGSGQFGAYLERLRLAAWRDASPETRGEQISSSVFSRRSGATNYGGIASNRSPGSITTRAAINVALGLEDGTIERGFERIAEPFKWTEACRIGALELVAQDMEWRAAANNWSLTELLDNHCLTSIEDRDEKKQFKKEFLQLRRIHSSPTLAQFEDRDTFMQILSQAFGLSENFYSDFITRTIEFFTRTRDQATDESPAQFLSPPKKTEEIDSTLAGAILKLTGIADGFCVRVDEGEYRVVSDQEEVGQVDFQVRQISSPESIAEPGGTIDHVMLLQLERILDQNLESCVVEGEGSVMAFAPDGQAYQFTWGRV
jgi:hypothetical protein